MGQPSNGDREVLYRRARIAAATGLFGLVIVLGLTDAINPDYTIDAIIFGLLLAAGLLLVGIDPGHLR